MAGFKRFEEIESWKEARVLVGKIYSIDTRDYGYKDQIRRSAVSVMSNIAEGFGREGKPEFAQFLTIAKGSLNEVKSLLYVALDLKYINRELFDELYRKAVFISSALTGLIKYLRKAGKKNG